MGREPPTVSGKHRFVIGWRKPPALVEALESAWRRSKPGTTPRTATAIGSPGAPRPETAGLAPATTGGNEEEPADVSAGALMVGRHEHRQAHANPIQYGSQRGRIADLAAPRAALQFRPGRFDHECPHRVRQQSHHLAVEPVSLLTDAEQEISEALAFDRDDALQSAERIVTRGQCADPAAERREVERLLFP